MPSFAAVLCPFLTTVFTMSLWHALPLSHQLSATQATCH